MLFITVVIWLSEMALRDRVSILTNGIECSQSRSCMKLTSCA